jgi:hypothetical protein
MISDKILKINNPDSLNKYELFEGEFFIYTGKTIEFNSVDSCRELFSENFNSKTKYVGFHHSFLDIKKIDRFFTRREEKLKDQIPENKRTIIYKTDIENTLVLEISPFWRKNLVCRAMFTLLLRCACVYYENNFNDAIENYNLASLIKPTINHFLEGNTIPTFKHIPDESVVEFFNGADNEFINQKLVKPKTNNKNKPIK